MEYLYISYDQSDDIYPNNNSTDFTVALPKTLYLKDSAKIAIKEFSFQAKNKKRLYLYCKQIGESLCGNSYKPVLCVVKSPKYFEAVRLYTSQH